MKHLPQLSLLAAAAACAAPPLHAQAITQAQAPRMRVLGHAPSQTQAAAAEAEATRLLGLMTRDEKLSFIGGTGAWDVKPLQRLGLPQIYGSDGGAGVRLSDPVGVNFPSGSVVASTWNAQLAFDVGAAMARDAKAAGFQNLLAPGMNIARIAFAGRSAEYGSGEDPYLGAVLMPAAINGIQSEGIWATAKHLAANDQETNRFALDVQVDERTLREIYLVPFESAVKSGQPANIMCAFNKVNGAYACESAHLVNEVVKRDWAYQGFVESDYNAVTDGLAAAQAGTDIDMPSGWQMNAATLNPALDAGTLSTAALDDKVRRILRQELLFGFGAAEPTPPTSTPSTDPRSVQIALDAAREGIVLLANRNATLPLARTQALRIGVIGQRAVGDPPKAFGSTYYAAAGPVVSILQGIRDAAPAGSTVDMIDAMTLDPARASSVAGFSGRYFTSASFSGTPALTRTDAVIDIDWSTLPGATAARMRPLAAPLAGGPQPSPDSPYQAIEWTGQLMPVVSGDHVFKVRADGAVQILVDGVEIASNGAGLPIVDTIPPTVPVYAKARLTAGVAATVTVRYVRKPGYISALGGFTGVQFSWAALEAVPALANYDAVVVAAGLGHEYEGEGFDRPFDMPEFQAQMIASVAAAKPRTVALVAAGGGVAMSGFADRAGALLFVGYPGQQGGKAIADVLFGNVNPSGKMAVTLDARIEDNPAYAGFPATLNDLTASSMRYSEGLFVGYRGYDRSGSKPLFAFGHGLSYSQFTYTNVGVATQPMSCSAAAAAAATTAAGMPPWGLFVLPSVLLAGVGLRRRRAPLASAAVGLALVGCMGGGDDDVAARVQANQLVQVSFDLTNSGSMAGAEVAQLYVAPQTPGVERPAKELKGFTKVSLAAGETKHVTVTLNPRAFAYYDTQRTAWVTEGGRYRLLVGGASDDLPLAATVEHGAETLSVTASAPTTIAPVAGAPDGLCLQ